VRMIGLPARHPQKTVAAELRHVFRLCPPTRPSRRHIPVPMTAQVKIFAHS